MIDIFEKDKLDFNNLVCHSGGALGADTYFETIGEKYGVKTKAYSYNTPKHTGKNKVEISEEDYQEGVIQVNKANKTLLHYGINKYMNLLARNWCQVKYSEQIFAIGTILDSGARGDRGYYNKSKYQVVDGGTGYAVQMGIDNNKIVYVFEQNKNRWFRWSYTALRFVEVMKPIISYQNFAGIGTRKVNENGVKAIENLFIDTKNMNI